MNTPTNDTKKVPYLAALVRATHQLCRILDLAQPFVFPLLDTPEKNAYVALQTACNEFRRLAPYPKQ